MIDEKESTDFVSIDYVCDDGGYEYSVFDLRTQEALAKELKLFRQKKKYTQEDMAELLCIKQPVYSRFENAKMKKPSEAILTLIENTLNNDVLNYHNHGQGYLIKINRLMYTVPENSDDNSDGIDFCSEEIRNFIKKKENLPYIIEAYFKFKHDELNKRKESYLKKINDEKIKPVID